MEFKKWLQENYPNYPNEGFLQRIRPTAGNVTGAANTAIGTMGILGRLYTPFIGLGGPADLPRPHHVDRPAMVAKATVGKPVKNKVTLAKLGMIDDLGNTVGEPLNQGWWDAADWIPSNYMDKRKDSEQEDKVSQADDIVAIGPLNPGKSV